MVLMHWPCKTSDEGNVYHTHSSSQVAGLTVNVGWAWWHDAAQWVSRIAWLTTILYQFLYQWVCQEVWGHNVAFQGKLRVSVFREDVKETIQNTLLLLLPYVPYHFFIIFLFLISFPNFIPFFPSVRQWSYWYTRTLNWEKLKLPLVICVSVGMSHDHLMP